MTICSAPTSLAQHAEVPASADPQTLLDGHIRATGTAVVHRALAGLPGAPPEPDTSSLARLSAALEEEEPAC